MDHDYPSVRLPQELTDYILGLLADDLSSLRNCARVASPWLPTARKLLFNHLPLDLCTVSQAAQSVFPPTPMQIFARQTELHNISLDTLFQCLQRAPDLPSYVHHLTLRPGQYVHTGNPMRGQVARRLLRVLQRLTFIQSINMNMGDWQDYSPDFQSALRHLLALDSLTSIEIHHGRLGEIALAGLLPQKPSLTSLSLSAMEVQASPLNASTSSPSLVPGLDGISLTSNLDNLHIFGVGLLVAICSWFEIYGIEAIPLQKLYIGERFGNWNCVQHLLNLAGRHLQSLVLEGPSRCYGVPPPMADLFLDKSVSLRMIEVLHLEQSELYSPVSWLLSIFSSVSEPLALEVITINLGVTRISYDLLVDEPSWDEWAELDKILFREEFNNLQLLEINVYTSAASTLSPSEVAQELCTRFCRMQARRILNVKPCSYFEI